VFVNTTNIIFDLMRFHPKMCVLPASEGQIIGLLDVYKACTRLISASKFYFLTFMAFFLSPGNQPKKHFQSKDHTHPPPPPTNTHMLCFHFTKVWL